MNQYQRDVYYGSEPDKGQDDEPELAGDRTCKICGKGKIKYTGEGQWYKCGNCVVTESYVDTEPGVVECPDCEGSGELEAGYGENAYDVKCERCDGEGVVEDE